MTQQKAWGILITHRVIVASSAIILNSQNEIVQLDLDFSRDIVRVEGPFDDQEQLKCALRETISALREKSGTPHAVTISCSRRFASTNETDRDISSYGQIAKSHLSPRWTGLSIFEFLCDELNGILPTHRIFCKDDVKAAALGELSWLAAHDCLLNQKCVEKLSRMYGLSDVAARLKSFRDTRVFYIKFSDQIDGDFVNGANLFMDTTPPTISDHQCTILKEDSAFPGICPGNPAGFSSRVSSVAVSSRLKVLDLPKYCDLEIGHPQEAIIAEYGAQLCSIINNDFKPTLIVVGGRLVEDKYLLAQDDDAFIDRDLPGQINSLLIDSLRSENRLKGHPNKRAVSRTDTVRHPDFNEQVIDEVGFVRKARCPYPVIYGCLAYSAKKMYHNSHGPKILQLPLDSGEHRARSQ